MLVQEVRFVGGGRVRGGSGWGGVRVDGNGELNV